MLLPIAALIRQPAPLPVEHAAPATAKAPALLRGMAKALEGIGNACRSLTARCRAACPTRRPRECSVQLLSVKNAETPAQCAERLRLAAQIHDAETPTQFTDRLQRATHVHETMMRDYSAGHKSANRVRVSEYQAETDDGDSRRQRAVRDVITLRKMPNTEMSGVLRERIPAGNCGILAWACALRARDSGLNAAVMRFASHDHAFAVIAPAGLDIDALPPTAHFNEPHWRKVIVLDPWTRTLAMAPDFEAALSGKLEKWTTDGKINPDRYVNGEPFSWNDGWVNRSLKQPVAAYNTEIRQFIEDHPVTRL